MMQNYQSSRQPDCVRRPRGSAHAACSEPAQDHADGDCVAGTENPRKRGGDALPRSVLLLVLVVAGLVAALAISANQLWASTEARSYVVLGADIAERFDFSHELFLLRTPGYPLFMAGIFRMFGPASGTAILVIQYVLVACIAMFTALIAWEVTHRRWVAGIAGIVSACNLQLLAFASMIMSEVPYTLTLLVCLYLILRFFHTGRPSTLVLASVMAGVAYLLRPLGLLMLIIGGGAVMFRHWRLRALAGRKGAVRDGASTAKTETAAKRDRESFEIGLDSRRRRRLALLAHLGLAVVPGLVPIVGWNVVVASHGGGMDGTLGPSFFKRAVTMDKLDSTTSRAWLEVQRVVREAKQKGYMPADADIRHGGTFIDAYQLTGRGSYEQACAFMKEVGLDLMREHAGLVAWNTLRYMAWTMLEPDSSYRYLPGGEPGVRLGPKKWTRAEGAEIFDSATYEPLMARYLNPYRRYLTFQNEPKVGTPLWTAVVRWFHRRVETPTTFLGLPISPYEAFIWLSGLGMVLSLATRRRVEWMLIAGTIVLQIGASSLSTGHVPRYAIPIQPLVGIAAAFVLVAIVTYLLVPLKMLTGWRRASLGVELPAPRLEAPQ